MAERSTDPSPGSIVVWPVTHTTRRAGVVVLLLEDVDRWRLQVLGFIGVEIAYYLGRRLELGEIIEAPAHAGTFIVLDEFVKLCDMR